MNIANQFTELDPTIKYYCSSVTKSANFNILMKYVLMDHLDEKNKKTRKSIYYERIKKLLESQDCPDINYRNEQGWTGLMIACRNSNTYSSTAIVELLLEFGADVNICNNDCNTALMYCMNNLSNDSNIDTMNLLLKYNADINIINANNYSVLSYAIQGETVNFEMLKLLIPHANINSISLMLFNAIDILNVELIEYLLENNANVNIFSTFETPLIYILRKFSLGYYSPFPKFTNIINLLLKYGADVNLPNKSGSNPIFCLKSDNQNYEYIKLLLDHGANVNCQYEAKYNTPLMQCLEYGKSANNQIIKLLLDYGCDFTVRETLNNNTIFDIINRTKYQKFANRDGFKVFYDYIKLQENIEIFIKTKPVYNIFKYNKELIMLLWVMKYKSNNIINNLIRYHVIPHLFKFI